jgi:hypothetical protein
VGEGRVNWRKTLRGIRRSGVGRTPQKAEGERLDDALARLRQTGQSGATGATEAPASTDEFASILGAGGVGQRAARHNSLEADVVDFTIPRITKPDILTPSNAISLLERFLVDDLPNLEGGELRVLATRLIKDEISKLRDILERQQAGIVA